MIAVIDSGVSNTGSVTRALTRLGLQFQVTAEHQILAQARWILLPGVGSFGDSMDRLEHLRLVDLLRELVLNQGKNFLGICLGLQLLAQRGWEGGSRQGLGLIEGEVVPIPEQPGLRIPHMGWNEIKLPEGSHLQAANLPDFNFYFMHSYHLEVADPQWVSSRVTYGTELVASVRRDNLVAVQFHPEKSQAAGLRLLQAILC